MPQIQHENYSFVAVLMIILSTCIGNSFADTASYYYWDNNISKDWTANGDQFSSSEGTILTNEGKAEVDGNGKLRYLFKPDHEVGFSFLKPHFDGRMSSDNYF